LSNVAQYNFNSLKLKDSDSFAINIFDCKHTLLHIFYPAGYPDRKINIHFLLPGSETMRRQTRLFKNFS